MRYKAFMSYSHAVDSQFAPVLQSALQRFAKPFYRRRAISIFRDKTSLHLTPELWPTIQQALRESELFLLLASEEAAKSKWVQKEVDEWLSLHDGSAAKILIVLTDGEIRWDAEAGDFDWTTTKVLPPNLRGKFVEPLYLDFRWVRSSRDLSMRNPHFLDQIGTIAAALHGKPKEEMIGEDVSAHRLFRRVSAGVAVVLAALALAALLAAYVAGEQRKVAQARRLLAEAELAQAAANANRGSWADLRQRSFLLTDAAAVRAGAALGPQTAALDRSVRLVARSLPQSEREIQLEMEPEFIDYTVDGRRLLLELPDWLSVRDARSGREIGRLPKPIDKNSSSWTPTLSYLAGETSDDIFRVWQIGETVKELKLREWPHRVVSSAFSPDGQLLATADQGDMFRVTRVADGAELMAVRREERIDHIVFDPTGKQVAVAEKRIRTFALPDPDPQKVFPFGVYNVAFSPDGRLIAGASNTTVVVWDLQSEVELREILVLPAEDEGDPDEVIRRVSFTSDSRSIAILTDKGWVARYDIRSGEKTWPTTTASDRWEDNFVVDRWSMLGATAMREIPGGVEFWDTLHGRHLATVEGGEELSAAAFDAVTHTAALAEGKRLRLINMNPGDEIAGAVLPGETKTFSVGGQTFGIRTNMAFGLWTWRMPAWWQPPKEILDYKMSEDGARVAVLTEDGLGQWTVDSRTGEVKPGPALRFDRGAAFPPNRENQNTSIGFRYSKSGKYCIAIGNGRWYIWSSATGEMVQKGADDEQVTNIFFDGEERAVWYFNSANELWVRDLSTKDGDAAPPRKVTTGPGGLSSFFSPEGRYAYIRDSKKKRILLWEPRMQKPVLAIPFGDLDDFRFELRDRFLVVTENRMELSEEPYLTKIYDLAARRPAAGILHALPVKEIAFSNDGSVLATVDETHVVQLTDTETWQQIGRVPFNDPVEGMALSHDGRYLCVYGTSGLARVWDLSRPEEPLEIAQLHHERRVRWVEFTPDARYLVTIDEDSRETQAHRWILSTEELLSRIRPHIRREFTENEQKDFFRDVSAAQIILAGIRRTFSELARGLRLR